MNLIHVAIMFKVFSSMAEKKDEILSIFKVRSLHDKAGKREYDRKSSQIYANLDTIIAPYILEIEKLSLALNTILSKPNQFNTNAHTSEQAWITSIVHMHFNRVFGDVKLENLLRAQVFRLLKRKWRNL